MVAKNKAPTYEPFGDTLDAETALLQAAASLDMAVHFAVITQNVEKLMDASAMWMGLAERLARGFDDEESDEEYEENPNKPAFGFQNISKIEETKKEENPEDA